MLSSEDYIAKAKEFVYTDDKSCNLLSLEFMKKDYEMEMERKLRDKEMERKLSEKDYEMAMERELSKQNLTASITQAVLMKQLSSLSQRYCLEYFFDRIVWIYKHEPESCIRLVIDAEDNLNPKEGIVKSLQSSRPTMTAVNRILLNNKIHDAVWDYFNFEKSCPLPRFSDGLLYGAISDIIHNPGLKNIFVSSAAGQSYACFFNLLANWQSLPLNEFDEGLASMDVEGLDRL